MDDIALVQVIASGLLGALIGAVIGSFSTIFAAIIARWTSKQTERMKLTFRIYEDFTKRVELIEEAIKIIKNDATTHTDGNGYILDKAKHDKVAEVGTFFDSIAFMYLSSYIDKNFVRETKIIKWIDNFRNGLEEKKIVVPKPPTISTTEYDHMAWETGWPYLARIRD